MIPNVKATSAKLPTNVAYFDVVSSINRINDTINVSIPDTN
jgi:hypothetical protein